MDFEKIGPCKLSLSDAVAASLAISFLLGSMSVRLSAALSILIWLAMIAFGIHVHAPVLIGMGVFIIAFQFFIAPALRSRQSGEGLYLECSTEGLLVETLKMRAMNRAGFVGGSNS